MAFSSFEFHLPRRVKLSTRNSYCAPHLFWIVFATASAPADQSVFKMKESDLVDKVVAEDEEAETRLINAYKDTLLLIATKKVGRDAAEDLVQEVLSALFLSLRRGVFKQDGSLKAYVYGIFRNKVSDFLRSHPPRTEPLDGMDLGFATASAADRSLDENPEARLINKERKQTVVHVLNKMKRKHKEVIVLHYFERYSVEEISKMLHRPRGTILHRLFEARKHFVKILNQTKGNLEL